MGHVLLAAGSAASFILPTDMTLLRAVVALGIVFVCVRALPLRPRRFLGGALLLLSVAAFRLAARTLPEHGPLRTWALSMSGDFPLTWRGLCAYAALAAPTPAD